MQGRVDAERQRGALGVGHRVGQNPEAAGKSRDGIEQQRRAFRHAGRNLRDRADLVMRIGARDVPQRAQRLDLADEVPKIPIAQVYDPACDPRYDYVASQRGRMRSRLALRSAPAPVPS